MFSFNFILLLLFGNKVYYLEVNGRVIQQEKPGFTRNSSHVQGHLILTMLKCPDHGLNLFSTIYQ